jgi:hypothetical protein
VAGAFATLLAHRVSKIALDYTGGSSAKQIAALSATELRRLDRYIAERLDQGTHSHGPGWLSWNELVALLPPI